MGKEIIIMKKKRFYYLLLKSGNKFRVLYKPVGTDTRFGAAVTPVEGYEHMVFELRSGIYKPFMNSNCCACFADEDLKQLLEENIPEDCPLEFLPVKATSKEYGDKLYYIIHFTKVFDVIDKENSKYVPETGDITIPCIDYEKAKDLDFFNSTARISGFIVSDKIKKLMKKRGLDVGIEFWEWNSI